MFVSKTALAWRTMKTGRRLGAVLLALAALVAALLLVSGEERSDPRTPAALPGMPAAFLGVAVLGEGELTAAVDAYGNVVDLRPQPAGPALIENPADRQAAGTVAADTGIQPWVRIGQGPELPMWRADRVRQRYLAGTNVLRTEAWFDGTRVVITQAVHGGELAIVVGGDASAMKLRSSADTNRITKDPRVLAEAATADRRWLGGRRLLGGAAPSWAHRMYERSLLVLRALTDRGNGAVAAGARDGWAYVWPRDAGAVAIALAAAGYQTKAELTVRFLLGLDLEGTARFYGDGSPVPGRDAQGDAIGWVAAAAKAAGIIGDARHAVKIFSETYPVPWQARADYWEGEPGDYLANTIASGEPAVADLYEGQLPARLVRQPDKSDSGLDSAAAWAVRPFPRPRLFEPARRTLLRLTEGAGRFGLLPGEDWEGGEDPWSAPTAWTAWSLAALGERRHALRLMRALRLSATPAGMLPERVDAETGIPRSTTPLAWSHAFALLALRELWPSR
jgi:hypothetical protein